MKLSRLATSREFTLSILALVLLSLTGSASRVSTDPLPHTPSAPAAAVVPTTPPVRTSTPTPVPRSAAKPAAKPAGPRVPIVSAALRPPPRIRTDQYPVRVVVAGVDISLPIKPVGVTKKREMELPGTIAEVGWYRFGANPSWKNGATVLASHVDTRAEGLGPFARLSEVKKGAEVTITDKNGGKFSYRVAKVTRMDKSKVPWPQVFDERGHPRLVMITCGGAYDQESGYRDNVLVTAFPFR